MKQREFFFSFFFFLYIPVSFASLGAGLLLAGNLSGSFLTDLGKRGGGVICFSLLEESSLSLLDDRQFDSLVSWKRHQRCVFAQREHIRRSCRELVSRRILQMHNVKASRCFSVCSTTPTRPRLRPWVTMAKAPVSNLIWSSNFPVTRLNFTVSPSLMEGSG